MRPLVQKLLWLKQTLNPAYNNMKHLALRELAEIGRIWHILIDSNDHCIEFILYYDDILVLT